MASELVIRPGRGDQHVIADLLAPGGASIYLPDGRPVIDRLVVDAHLAPTRPRFAASAREAGIPMLVDPLTPLWQAEVRGGDAWAALPFGREAPFTPAELSKPSVRDLWVAKVVDFQLEHGATAIIPPYVHGEQLRADIAGRLGEAIEPAREVSAIAEALQRCRKDRHDGQADPLPCHVARRRPDQSEGHLEPRVEGRCGVGSSSTHNGSSFLPPGTTSERAFESGSALK